MTTKDMPFSGSNESDEPEYCRACEEAVTVDGELYCEGCEADIAAEGAYYFAEYQRETKGMPPSENGHSYGCVCDVAIYNGVWLSRHFDSG